MSNETQQQSVKPVETAVKPAGQARPWVDAIAKAEARFVEISAAEGNSLNYRKEALFALQTLENSAYLLDAAKGNPTSLYNAVINIASIGLSLNPAEKLAYLVPRDKRVCLDISYIGLIKLATDTRNIAWVKADLVYSEDDFEVTGINSIPVHKYNPFKDRGTIIGGYSVAKLNSGDCIVDIQTEEYFQRCRGVAKTKNIWDQWPEAMRLKSLVKVGSKFWPKSKQLDTAIHVLNEEEGIDVVSHKITAASMAEEDVPEARKAGLRLIAEKIDDFMAEGDIIGATSLLDANDLLIEEAAYLWTRLDSKIRSAIKKYQAETKKVTREAAAKNAVIAAAADVPQ